MKHVFHEWTDEIIGTLDAGNYVYAGLFSENGDLIRANPALLKLLACEQPKDCFVNPSFETLKGLKGKGSYVYGGFMTIGKGTGDDVSILVNVYRKKQQLLILGGADVQQLEQQNDAMRHMNQEIIHLQRDVLKEKKELERTLRILKEANATKDKFLSVIAHDLKNPFQILMGFSDILLENYKELNEEQVNEQLTIIHKTVHKTYDLLEDLLTWSRVQLGRIRYQPDHLQLEQLVAESLFVLTAQANKKQIKLMREIPSDLELYADEQMVKMILRNLITNAIKFSHRGGCIFIRAVSRLEGVMLSVHDQGVGISSENQRKLWLLSEQFTTRGTDDEEGSGLGLLLCKEFAERHGGSITVESEMGKGTTFQILFPGIPKG